MILAIHYISIHYKLIYIQVPPISIAYFATLCGILLCRFDYFTDSNLYPNSLYIKILQINKNHWVTNKLRFCFSVHIQNLFYASLLFFHKDNIYFLKLLYVIYFLCLSNKFLGSIERIRTVRSIRL